MDPITLANEMARLELQAYPSHLIEGYHAHLDRVRGGRVLFVAREGRLMAYVSWEGNGRLYVSDLCRDQSLTVGEASAVMAELSQKILGNLSGRKFEAHCRSRSLSLVKRLCRITKEKRLPGHYGSEDGTYVAGIIGGGK